MVEPSVSERAATLIERLFSAPANPATWQAFLADVSAELGRDCVTLLLGELIPDGPTVVLGHGVDLSPVLPEDVQPAGEHPPPEVLPIGKAVPIQASDLTLARSRLFQTVLSKRGLAPGPGLYVPLFRNPRHVTGALFVLSPDAAWKPAPEDFTLLELLAPYITNAVRAGMRFYEEQTRASALLHALGRLQLGVILIGVGNQVSFANDSALEMLGLADVVAPEEEVRRRATAALSSLLKRETGGSTQTLTYPHPEDERPLSILVTPLRWGDATDAERRRFTTALFVSDPHGATDAAGATLRKLYGLTTGEARLTEQLAAGRTLAEAAESLGIRPSTARGVLRSVFEKTGTHRQSSLVRLILSGPGQVRDRPAGEITSRGGKRR
ncbi:MAG: helix-turn-helix transcriptional regulator [Myxococcota bacterium]